MAIYPEKDKSQESSNINTTLKFMPTILSTNYDTEDVFNRNKPKWCSKKRPTPDESEHKNRQWTITQY
ncbi:hypothetical protein GGER_07650 [Serratia rubidaea]